MSQRNPMNERYLGDGPAGKTKKSAAKLKPKSAAASSVHIEAKPTNRQERKAAHRRRDAEEKRKAEERERKASERERKAQEASGEAVAEAKKPGLLDRLFPKKSPPPAHARPAGIPSTSTATSSAGTAARQSAFPTTKQYKDLRRIYWILLAIGIVFVVSTFIVQNYLPGLVEYWGYLMGAAYVCIIGAFILDFAKIRPLVREHQRQLRGGNGKSSPKQIKHQEEAAERARMIEEFNKAKKQARRKNRHDSAANTDEKA